MFDDQTEPQLVPKILLNVFLRELYKSLLSDLNDGGLKDARDEDDNIIISDSTLRSLFPPQLKKCPHDTRSCVVVNVVFMLKLYIYVDININFFTSSSCSVSHFLQVMVIFGGQKKSKIWQMQILKISST